MPKHIFVVLWSYLLTTKLSSLQKNIFGHTRSQGRDSFIKWAEKSPLTCGRKAVHWKWPFCKHRYPYQLKSAIELSEKVFFQLYIGLNRLLGSCDLWLRGSALKMALLRLCPTCVAFEWVPVGMLCVHCERNFKILSKGNSLEKKFRYHIGNSSKIQIS